MTACAECESYFERGGDECNETHLAVVVVVVQHTSERLFCPARRFLFSLCFARTVPVSVDSKCCTNAMHARNTLSRRIHARFANFCFSLSIKKLNLNNSCSHQAPLYSCPRCNARYCSSACYQAHSEQCTESFARDHAVQELRGMTAAGDDDDDFSPAGNRDDHNSGSRTAMLKVLQRIREADAAAPLDPEQALVASLRRKMTLGDDEENEGEGDEESSGDDDFDDDDLEDKDEDENDPLPLATLGITLSAETSRRLRELDREYSGSADGPPEEAVFAALSEEERLAFFEAVAAKDGEAGEEGEDEERLRPPWWEASDPLSNRLDLPALSKDGTALVSEIGGESDHDGDDDDDSDGEDDQDEKPSSSYFPPPPSSPLPRLASLLPARANGIPAPGVESTVVCALYGYCWAMRRCRGGEWRRRKKGGGKGKVCDEGDDDDDKNAASLFLSSLSETALIVSGLSQSPQPGVPPPPLRAALAGCVELAANDVSGIGACSALPAMATFATSLSSSPAARRASAIAGIADARAVLSAGRTACVLALEDLRSLLLDGAAVAAAASSSTSNERGAPPPSSPTPSSSSAAGAAGGKLAALRAKRAAAAEAEQAREMSLLDERVVLGKAVAPAKAAIAATKRGRSSSSSSAASSLKLAAKRVLFLTCWANEAPPEILSATAEAVSVALEEAAATVPAGKEAQGGEEGKKSALEVLSSVSASTKKNGTSSSVAPAFPASPSLLIEEL